jgi:hypothetical protein
MKTGRWLDLSTEQEFSYTGNERFLVITMSRTSGVTDGLYGFVGGESGPKIRQEFSPRRAQPRVLIHVFEVEVASHQDWQSPAETGGQVRSDQWAGRRKLSRKDYQRSAGQRDLDGGSLQVGQARNGH